MFGSLGTLKKGLHFENVTLDLHSIVLWLDFTGCSDSNSTGQASYFSEA